LRYLIVILLFLSTTLYGVDNAPKLLRSCINFNDSTVTISWMAPTDACASFTHYSVYENENGGTFNRIAVIPNITVVEYPHKIPNLNTNRSYYVTVHTLCDGLDSATSQTLSLDDVYPANIGLDSVSYDLATQNIIAGWQPNPSVDTKGYQIYDYQSGNGDSIGFTSATSYIVSTDPLDVFPVVIATLDSCNLSSILSTPHRVMRLSHNFDSCTGTMTLNWTLYQGWQSIESQDVMVSINGSPYTNVQTVASSATSYSITNITLGDNICFYIRSFTAGGTISSSSNRICVQTRELEYPSYIYLSRVTVIDDDKVLLEWETDNASDQAKYYIHRSDNGDPYVSRFNVPITDQSELYYTGINPTVNVHEDHHLYKVTCENVCGVITMESNEATTIRLGFGPNYQRNHNHYLGFDGGVEKYDLQKLQPDGFTWNTIRTQDTPFTNIEFYNDSTGCYRVLATENFNSFGYYKTSLSNTECILAPLTYYMPNAISLTSENNRFIILGEGIDHSRSYYQIYNRWGEMLASRSTKTAWYGDYEGQEVIPGLYMYVAHIYGVMGEKKMVKDYIYVFK
jgi:hypothetical protein